MRFLPRLVTAIFCQCSHSRTTFPLTPVGKFGPTGSPYVVCLDCGKEFNYDWNNMRVAAPRESSMRRESVVTQEVLE